MDYFQYFTDDAISKIEEICAQMNSDEEIDTFTNRLAIIGKKAGEKISFEEREGGYDLIGQNGLNAGELDFNDDGSIGIWSDKITLADIYEENKKQLQDITREIMELERESKKKGCPQETLDRLNELKNVQEDLGKKAARSKRDLDEFIKAEKSASKEANKEIRKATIENSLKVKYNAAKNFLEKMKNNLIKANHEVQYKGKEAWAVLQTSVERDYRNTLSVQYRANQVAIAEIEQKMAKTQHRYDTINNIKSTFANIGRACENFRNTLTGKELNDDRVTYEYSVAQESKIKDYKDMLEYLKKESDKLKLEFNKSVERSADRVVEMQSDRVEKGLDTSKGLDHILDQVHKERIGNLNAYGQAQENVRGRSMVHDAKYDAAKAVQNSRKNNQDAR